jgi:hypothetical protein
MAPKKKREKMQPGKMLTQLLPKNIHKDLHTMVLEAEAALAKPKKDRK